MDVSKHGGHAYPGMEDVYISELKGLDVTTDDGLDTKNGSSGIDYSLGDIVLQGQVLLQSPSGHCCRPCALSLIALTYTYYVIDGYCWNGAAPAAPAC